MTWASRSCTGAGSRSSLSTPLGARQRGTNKPMRRKRDGFGRYGEKVTAFLPYLLLELSNGNTHMSTYRSEHAAQSHRRLANERGRRISLLVLKTGIQPTFVTDKCSSAICRARLSLTNGSPSSTSSKKRAATLIKACLGHGWKKSTEVQLMSPGKRRAPAKRIQISDTGAFDLQGSSFAMLSRLNNIEKQREEERRAGHSGRRSLEYNIRSKQIARWRRQRLLCMNFRHSTHSRSSDGVYRALLYLVSQSSRSSCSTLT